MTPSRRAALLALLLFSGAAALVYEVLWLKELGRLFGVTAYASAATLAVFFLGLAAGSFVWGRRAARDPNPLRTYGLLELAIAGSALLYFLLLDLYRWLYPALFAALGGSGGDLIAAKLLLAVLILFPSAFFMGGTLPVMGQFLVRRASELGRTATLLYAVNTLGAAIGALTAGFVLPRLLGFRGSYLTAIALNVVIATIALAWSRGQSGTGPGHSPAILEPRASAVAPSMSRRLIWTLAAASGFLTLALEVLWTRMFSQVLQNSVYTFSVILTLFLVALALGSAVAHLLCRTEWPERRVLFTLLVASGLAVAASASGFYRLTGGLALLGSDLGWNGYVLAVFSTTAAVLLVPGALVGSVFPYLLKTSEPGMRSAGKTVGQLAAANTLAAIFGSLAAGFLLLDWLGLWQALRLVAVAYLLLSLALVVVSGRVRVVPLVAVAAGLALLLLVFDTDSLAAVRLDPQANETVVAVREDAQGTVAVVRRDDDLRLKVNNHYLLATAQSTPNLRLQAWFALSLHPDPRSVFFLGMGTGITAGGALDFPVESVTVTELNPQVVELAEGHFSPYLNGLFEDPRARILATDGRAYLAGTAELFDLVIGDIFLTYRAGVGSLYTREHFTAVRDRLATGGLFVQWLPMFDLSQRELGIIIRTLLDVFPQVTLWRRGFSPRFPVYGLVASASPVPLDPEGFRARLGGLVERGVVSPDLWFQKIPLAAYAGNPSAIAEEYRRYPPNIDDWPVLEYLSPVTERNAKGSMSSTTLAWVELADYCQLLLDLVPGRSDPFLARASERDQVEVEAGLAYQAYEAYRRVGNTARAATALNRYQELAAALEGLPAADSGATSEPLDKAVSGSSP